MSTPRRSLDKLFEAARTEASPVTSEATRSLVASAESVQRRSFRMSPTILALTTAAIVAAAGITIKVIHGTEPEKKTPAIASVIPSTTTDDEGSAATTDKPPTESKVLTTLVAEKSEDDKGRVVHRIAVMDRIGVLALQADDDIFRSMGVEPMAIQNICRNLAGAEEVKNCTPAMQDAKVKVCIMKDGATDEVVFMERPGPLPVMFTSSTGKGRVLSNASLQNVDPNSLVPVAAKGCGENVVMWFHPNEEFLFAMPDSLKQELESVITIEQDVSITNDDGKIIIKRKQRNADGTTSETIQELTEPPLKFHFDKRQLDSVLKSSLGSTQDAFKKMKVDIKMQMKDLRLKMDSLMELNDVEIKIDSLMKDIEIKIEKNMNNVDGIEEEQVFHWNDDQRQIHHIEVVRAPNVRSRIVVLSSRRTTPPAPDVPLRPGSLQETRTSAGSIANSSVYPNPVTEGGATIAFELTEARRVTLQVLDLAGDIVRQPQTNIQRGPGQWQFAVAMNDLAPGMYLLALTTDAGERAVQRLIVQ